MHKLFMAIWKPLIRSHIDLIGHVQIAAIHDRGEPDQGEINLPPVLGVLDSLGYEGFIGAEYHPRGEER